MMFRTIRMILVATFVLGASPVFTGGGTVSAAKKYERQLLRLHNKERKKRGLRKLRRNKKLTRSAKGYAKDMDASGGPLSHTGLDGRTFADRIRDAGYKGKTTGENIAWGQTSAKQVFRGWMRSTGHRRNIRNRSFRDVGFGNSGLFWVTNFGG